MTTEDGTNEHSTRPASTGDPSVPLYELRVGGHLSPRWAAWFDGLDVTADDDGTTVIRGSVVDQAALHGLIQKVRDIGIPLVSLSQSLPDAAGDLPALPNHPIPDNPAGATP
ncbi:MAG: hypothetical protein JWN46_3854 [Acidimicrobiales bacterium]|nr:hypothetical protein [Acidimicrobiales bacterium]